MFAKTRLALLVGWVTGGVAFPLLAQETTKNETIVVTSQMQSGATKIATPDIETPQSVSIITREQFEEQGAISVRQAVSYTPGVYSNQIGASNRFDYIVLRGFSDGSLDNVYLDGLKMMGDTNSHSSLVVDPWFLEISKWCAARPRCCTAALHPAASSPSPRVNPHSIPAEKLSCLPGITTSAGQRLTLPGRWTITIAWRRA